MGSCCFSSFSAMALCVSAGRSLVQDDAVFNTIKQK